MFWNSIVPKMKTSQINSYNKKKSFLPELSVLWLTYSMLPNNSKRIIMKEGEITVINIKFAVSIFDKTFVTYWKKCAFVLLIFSIKEPISWRPLSVYVWYVACFCHALCCKLVVSFPHTGCKIRIIVDVSEEYFTVWVAQIIIQVTSVF